MTPESGGSWNGAALGRDLTSEELAMARRSWRKVSSIAAEHEGRVGAVENGVVRVEFPWHARAAGFYDEMLSRYLVVDAPTMDSVLVRKPK